MNQRIPAGKARFVLDYDLVVVLKYAPVGIDMHSRTLSRSRVSVFALSVAEIGPAEEDYRQVVRQLFGFTAQS